MFSYEYRVEHLLVCCHNDLVQDYDRDPEILMHLEAYKVLVLCSKLQIIPCRGCTEDSFKLLLKELLDVKWSGKTRIKLEFQRERCMKQVKIVYKLTILHCWNFYSLFLLVFLSSYNIAWRKSHKATSLGNFAGVTDVNLTY